MNGHGKSDRPIVPKKPPNKGRGTALPAEVAEGRGLAKGNPPLQNQPIGHRAATGWQSALVRIRQAALCPIGWFCRGGLPWPDPFPIRPPPRSCRPSLCLCWGLLRYYGPVRLPVSVFHRRRSPGDPHGGRGALRRWMRDIPVPVR